MAISLSACIMCSSHYWMILGVHQQSNQPIPVLAVSPQPKSHVSDLEGVNINAAPQLDSSFESKIDWSKATITPSSTSKAGEWIAQLPVVY